MKVFKEAFVGREMKKTGLGKFYIKDKPKNFQVKIRKIKHHINEFNIVSEDMGIPVSEIKLIADRIQRREEGKANRK